MYEAQKAYNKRKYAEDADYRAWKVRLSCASQKRRRATADGWAQAEIRRIKHRSKERGLPFDITTADLEVPALCPVLGIPITLGAPPRSPGLPSIDRIIPELGYVRGNICVISWRANNLKHDCTNSQELRLVADYIDRYRSACNG
jgi:hypothetical protein